jgi:hypothetical protein
MEHNASTNVSLLRLIFHSMVSSNALNATKGPNVCLFQNSCPLKRALLFEHGWRPMDAKQPNIVLRAL